MSSKKKFLAVASGVLAAIVFAFPFAVLQAQTGPAGWQADWERVLAAAKKEGKVAIISPAGDVYRNVWDTFQKKYGIAVEMFATVSPTDAVLRIDGERKSGQFLWDVVPSAPGAQFSQFKLLGRWPGKLK